MQSRAGVTVETLVSLKEALNLVMNENANVDLSPAEQVRTFGTSAREGLVAVMLALLLRLF